MLTPAKRAYLKAVGLDATQIAAIEKGQAPKVSAKGLQSPLAALTAHYLITKTKATEGQAPAIVAAVQSKLKGQAQGMDIPLIDQYLTQTGQR